MKDEKTILIEIVKRIVKKKEITLDSRMVEDLGFDSILFVRLIMELESKLNYDPASASEEVDFTEIKTIDHILNLANNYRKH